MFIRSGFYKAGNFVAAINAFTAALLLDDSIPSYPLILKNRGLSRFSIGKTNEGFFLLKHTFGKKLKFLIIIIIIIIIIMVY